ncbi:DNA-directed RNA polymerase II subunit RPB4 [Nematocida sp. LUAm3]|nr:DNA-directed RNA polymerase II subunit RPB4 [Nematocida sp. LUAm3]KAI5175879.1 DNA-directed RNA polymerase II subunit RPB4 [Nematocida sp. LUAm2]KAI5178739.1 DNA-directed RNA polymerase II subunit RPB4 [Nematocida sp. LUAm1]
MKILEKPQEESTSISSAEALSLLERIKAERNRDTNEPFQMIMKYLKTCSLHGLGGWAERVRKLAEEKGVPPYEASMLINLSPETHTDAKALIPSLAAMDNYLLEMLLNEISEVHVE